MPVELKIEGERKIDLVAIAADDPLSYPLKCLCVRGQRQAWRQVGDASGALPFRQGRQAFGEKGCNGRWGQCFTASEYPGAQPGLPTDGLRENRLKTNAQRVIRSNGKPFSASRRGLDLREKRSQIATAVEDERSPIVRE